MYIHEQWRVQLFNHEESRKCNGIQTASCHPRRIRSRLCAEINQRKETLTNFTLRVVARVAGTLLSYCAAFVMKRWRMIIVDSDDERRIVMCCDDDRTWNCTSRRRQNLLRHRWVPRVPTFFNFRFLLFLIFTCVSVLFWCSNFLLELCRKLWLWRMMKHAWNRRLKKLQDGEDWRRKWTFD